MSRTSGRRECTPTSRGHSGAARREPRVRILIATPWTGYWSVGTGGGVPDEYLTFRTLLERGHDRMRRSVGGDDEKEETFVRGELVSGDPLQRRSGIEDEGVDAGAGDALLESFERFGARGHGPSLVVVGRRSVSARDAPSGRSAAGWLRRRQAGSMTLWNLLSTLDTTA